MLLSNVKMLIRNVTKKRVIADNAKLCNDIFSKFIGLMFSKSNKKKALILKFAGEKIISLHMFFVFYPIDVLFLDKNKIVVDKKENFKPFAFYESRKKAMYAIEMPNGTVKHAKTGAGDKIKF